MAGEKRVESLKQEFPVAPSHPKRVMRQRAKRENEKRKQEAKKAKEGAAKIGYSKKESSSSGTQTLT
jgi:hypothetical protein